MIYVRRTYNNGKDITQVVLDLRKPEITEPEDLPENTTYFQKLIWSMAWRVKQYLKRRERTNKNTGDMFSLVIFQCTRSLKGKWETHPGDMKC